LFDGPHPKVWTHKVCIVRDTKSAKAETRWKWQYDQKRCESISQIFFNHKTSFLHFLLSSSCCTSIQIARDPSGVADVLVRENLVNPDDLGSESYVGDVYVADGEYVISD
jgi:hypothetical protein